MSDLNDILAKVWPEVRKRHLYPELPPPKCEEGEERVGLDMKGKNISLSHTFVSEMSEVLAPQEVLEGLLDHAVSHYLFCPWDFSTHLKLYREAKKILKTKERAQRAADYFMDIVADTHCIHKKSTSLPKIYRHVNKGILDEAVHAVCQRIWGVDLGVKKHEKLSRKLSRLPYLERGSWMESIKRFARSIEHLLEIEENSGQMDKPSPMGSHNIQQYSPQEIEQGLQQLAAEAETPSEFKGIIDDFEDELLEEMQFMEAPMGLGTGRSLDADIFYYMKLAENYMLPLRKTPMKKSGSLYPHHHAPWEVGSPFQDIDPWTSFGKIMPGITQTWQRREGEVFSREEGTPDCIVIIDSSGSMTDPKRHISYSVLGAACACDAYLRNGAKVAVCNFSDASVGGQRILPYSRNREEIYRVICHYFGGGTQVKLKEIKNLQTEDPPDIFLITDMQITNLELLITYFNECTNRVTAVHIGDNKQVQNFCRSMAFHKNIGIYAVDKKEDIPRIVLGKIHDYLYMTR